MIDAVQISGDNLTGVDKCHTVSLDVAPKKLASFRINPEVLAAMQKLKDSDGISLTAQADFALRTWLESRGVRVEKPERKRFSPRKRP